MGAAETTEHSEYVLNGAKIYAQNCIQCHGPHGEGVIGMPLNRKANQVDPASPAGRDVYTLISNTLRQGRPGNSQTFERHQLPDGSWISYTAMPAWGRDFGGPLDDDAIKQLALFIMNKDGSQWNIPGTSDAPPQDSDLKPDASGVIPLPDSANPDVDASAKALLRNLGKSQCLTCHTIGAKGAKIGPDLTHVGTWGVDQAFLENWIKYANVDPKDLEHPQAMPHEQRMPVYWSANRAAVTPNLNLNSKILSEGPYYMPRFKNKLSDAEITNIARYLMGLK
jgi:mono/diheme cytochrome c family protein